MPTSDLEGDFLAGVRDSIPVPDILQENLNEVTSGLTSIFRRANLAINDENRNLNTTQVFLDIIRNIEQALAQSTFLTPTQAACVAMQIEQTINRTSLRALGRSLEAIRRSFTAVTRIVGFLVNFNATLDGFNAESFPTQCVQRALEISFCGRCTGRIPPLCRNTCGALVRGCFAGFYSGLEGEFGTLPDSSSALLIPMLGRSSFRREILSKSM